MIYQRGGRIVHPFKTLNVMKYYSISDYACAKECLAECNLLDQFGQPMYNEAFLKECKKIVAFFKNIYDKARSYIGDWACRIKLAWSSLKEAFVNKVYKNAKVLPDGSIYIQDVKLRAVGEMKLRVNKYRL